MVRPPGRNPRGTHFDLIDYQANTDNFAHDLLGDLLEVMRLQVTAKSRDTIVEIARDAAERQVSASPEVGLEVMSARELPAEFRGVRRFMVECWTAGR